MSISVNQDIPGYTFVLKYVKPSGVISILGKYSILTEVQTSCFLHKFITYLSWFENGFRFCDFFRGLISDLFAAGSVKHAEEVVVGAGHDGGVIAVPTALEFVKDAIVLIQRAQLRPQIFVNLKKESSKSTLNYFLHQL